MIEGTNLALDSLRIPESETVTLYPDGIRRESNRSLAKLPKGFSFAQTAAEGWAFGKQRPEDLAVYIVEKFKEHIKPNNE